MDLTLDSCYARALELHEQAADAPLGRPRIRGAKPWMDVTLRETGAFLRDFLQLRGEFREQQLAEMLSNTALEACSLMFSVGASVDVWRAWCSLAGELNHLSGEAGLATQLMSIARTLDDAPFVGQLVDAPLEGYRDDAVQYLVLRDRGRSPPASTPVDDLGRRYESLVGAVDAGVEGEVSRAVDDVVRFWRDETSYGSFEPGIFPVFEPQVNGAVAALRRQRMPLEPGDARFLQAALDE